MLLVNVSVEKTQKGVPADAAYLWEITKAYGVNFPQVAADKKKIYPYHPTYSSGKVGLPFNIAVDLRTMKITHTKSGKVTLSSLEAAAKSVLGN